MTYATDYDRYESHDMVQLVGQLLHDCKVLKLAEQAPEWQRPFIESLLVELRKRYEVEAPKRYENAMRFAIADSDGNIAQPYEGGCRYYIGATLRDGRTVLISGTQSGTNIPRLLDNLGLDWVSFEHCPYLGEGGQA